MAWLVIRRKPVRTATSPHCDSVAVYALSRIYRDARFARRAWEPAKLSGCPRFIHADVRRLIGLVAVEIEAITAGSEYDRHTAWTAAATPPPPSARERGASAIPVCAPPRSRRAGDAASGAARRGTKRPRPPACGRPAR